MKRILLVAAFPLLAACSSQPAPTDTIEDLTTVVNSVTESLTAEEREIYTSHTYNELRADHPQLYRELAQTHKEKLKPWIGAIERSLTPEDRAMILQSEESIDLAHERLGSYYGERGLSYRAHDMFFVPRRHMRTLGGLSRLMFPEDTIFVRIPARAPIVVHEEIHSNSIGLPGRVLNEGMTELITRRVIPTREPQTPQADILELIIRSVARKRAISNVHAFEMVVRAFHTGDLSEVHSAVPAADWSAIVALTLECERCSMVTTPDALNAYRELTREIRAILG